MSDRNRKGQQIVAATHVTHVGPIPRPDDLAHYERILPGAADRIIRMAEEQSAHRRELEAVVVRGNAKQQRYGLIAATIITIVAILCGTALALLGKDTAGLVTILSMIGIDAGVFVFGRMRQEKERTQKLSTLQDVQNQ